MQRLATPATDFVMQKSKFDPRFLDDIARVAGGAINIMSGLQQQVREDMRSRMDDMAARADLVPREDLDRAEAMILKLRQRVDDLEARLDKIEGKKVAPPKKTEARKPAAKKSPAKAKKKSR